MFAPPAASLFMIVRKSMAIVVEDGTAGRSSSGKPNERVLTAHKTSTRARDRRRWSRCRAVGVDERCGSRIREVDMADCGADRSYGYQNLRLLTKLRAFLRTERTAWAGGRIPPGGYRDLTRAAHGPASEMPISAVSPPTHFFASCPPSLAGLAIFP